MTKNGKWVLRHRPKAALAQSDLDWAEDIVTDPRDGELLVRNVYLSLDPTNRIWMSDREQYLPPVVIGDVMRGTTIGVVEKSRAEGFVPGDIVMPATGGWQTYCVSPARMTRKLRPAADVPLTAYLSVLGPTGLTAYFGLLDIGQPKPGETLVLSAAAGAVGSVAGQIGRIKGCRVVGIAGGAAKCNWLTDELGFDAAVDYKSQDVGATLDRLCPDGIDIDFENVGGEIMEAVFSRLNRIGRMILCGLISAYNDEGPIPGPADFGRILMQRLTVRGFIVIDYLSRSGEAFADLSRWIAEGQIHWKDHVIPSLNEAPDGLRLLFEGQNEGKLLVKISELT